MEKYTVEAGLNDKGEPIIKCSPGFYDELILECRAMVGASQATGQIRKFIENFPAIEALASMPTLDETKN